MQARKSHNLCEVHDNQVTTVCISSGCRHSSRLLCDECLFHHHCPKKRKIHKFIEDLKEVISEVEMDRLESAFDQAAYESEWNHFIQTCLHHVHQQLLAIVDKAKQATFNVNTSSSETLQELYALAYYEDELPLLRHEVIDFGASLLLHRGQLEHQLQLMEHRRQQMIRELKSIESQIKKQLHTFMQQAEEIIDRVTTPIDFGMFKNYKEERTISVDGVKPLQVFPSEAYVAAIGARGELCMWSKPEYQYQGKIDLKSKDRPTQYKHTVVDQHELIVLGLTNESQQDSLCVIQAVYPYEVLVDHAIKYHLNRIAVAENHIFTCDYRHTLHRYMLTNHNGQWVLQTAEEINLRDLMNRGLHNGIGIIDIQLNEQQHQVLIHMPTSIAYYDAGTGTLRECISESKEIMNMLYLGDEILAYTTKSCNIKVFSLNHNRMIKDFETPHTRIDNIVLIQKQIIAYVANQQNIIIQRLLDGSFIKIAVFVKLAHLAYDSSTRRFISCDVKGKLQVWGSTLEQ